MSVLSPAIPDAGVLDLFAGSGALGLEALSRGARAATFVERAPAALRVLRSNIAALEADERARVVASDALKFVDGLAPLAYDIALADPPYGRGYAASLVERFVSKPFARLLALEHRRDDPIATVSGARTKRYGDTSVTFIPATA